MRSLNRLLESVVPILAVSLLAGPSCAGPPRAAPLHARPIAMGGSDAGADSPPPASSSALVDAAYSGQCEAHALAEYACFASERACASAGFDPGPLVDEIWSSVYCCAYKVHAARGAVTLHMQVSSEGTVEFLAMEPRRAATNDPAFLACIEQASRSIRLTAAPGPARVTWPFRLVGGGCLIQ